jgi:uncharacterized protein (TIGR02118 family)
MRRPSSWLLVSAFALAAACSKAGDKGTQARGEDTTAAAAPVPAGPMAIVTVLHNPPKDTAAFEKYYAETHIPLVLASQDQIGFERAELTKFNSNLDGSKAARYRQAELYFPSMDALKKGTATPAFKQVADDLPKFATGGFDALIGVETK